LAISRVLGLDMAVLKASWSFISIAESTVGADAVGRVVHGVGITQFFKVGTEGQRSLRRALNTASSRSLPVSHRAQTGGVHTTMRSTCHRQHPVRRPLYGT
jgi:hypothetical protein